MFVCIQYKTYVCLHIFFDAAILLLRFYPKLVIRYIHVCSDIFTEALKVLSPSLKKKKN